MEIEWASWPLKYGYYAGNTELKTFLVLGEVKEGEFVCYSCRKSIRAQKTLVHVDRMAGKERRMGAYCVKCAYWVLGPKLRKREGGEKLVEILRVWAVGQTLVDGEVYVIPD